MAFTQTFQPVTAADTQENGDPWPFALVRDDETFLSDDAGELVAALIEGYEKFTDDEDGDNQALVCRATEAIKVAATAQAIMATDAFNEGRFDPDDASEEVLTALFGDRTLAVIGVDHWDHEVPLVLVATDYEPFSNEPTPTGNVLWVDPSTEIAFLQSLANLGIITFYIHEDH